MTKVCYVTGFLDIKRETWDKWEKRGVSTYLEYFFQYIDLFENNEKDISTFLFVMLMVIVIFIL